MRKANAGGMGATYGQLGDRVVDDVERVGSREVTRDLDDQRRRVNHPGLDDQNKNLGGAKAAGHTRDHTEYVPKNRLRRRVLNPILNGTTDQTLRAMREVAVRLVASEKLNTRPFQIVRV